MLQSSMSSASTPFNGVLVIRHGEAEQNALEFFNSNPKNKNYREVRLTATGKKQVTTTAQKLKQNLDGRSIRTIYASPLPRAKETAMILADILGVALSKIQETGALIETDFGKYEGVKYSEFPWDIYDHSHAKEYGGETYEDVQDRIKVFMDQLLSNRDESSTILLVTHGEPAKAIIEYITNAKKDMIQTGESVGFPWDVMA